MLRYRQRRRCANAQVAAPRQNSARAATRPSASAALEALTEAARSGAGNLLELSIEATRARATVGEISSRWKGVYGRYQRHRSAPISGVYGGVMDGDEGFDRIQRRDRRLRREEGRRPR